MRQSVSRNRGGRGGEKNSGEGVLSRARSKKAGGKNRGRKMEKKALHFGYGMV